MIKYVCDRCKKEFVRNNRGSDNWFLNYAVDVHRRFPPQQIKDDSSDNREDVVSGVNCDWDYGYADLCPECTSKFNKISYFFMVKTRIQIAGQDEVID